MFFQANIQGYGWRASYVLSAIPGFVVSLFQSVTSIQEQTLMFAPKLAALAGLLLLASPWLVRVLSEYATAMITRMGTLGH